MSRQRFVPAVNRIQRKEKAIVVPEAKVALGPSPMEVVLQIESRRMILGIKKNILAKEAGIKAEMYSYVMKRARLGLSLPDDCVQAILGALKRLEKK